MRPALVFAAAGLALSGCSTISESVNPPTRIEDACAMLAEKPSWWRALHRAEERWGASPGLVLAIIRQESAFTHDARPPRQGGFLLMPGKRPSSAYGYAQALDGTWAEYQRLSGRIRADRDDFDDAVDFVGWYLAGSQRELGLPLTDFANHYLAYHEGRGGFRRGTWRSKAWLQQVSRRVAANAASYNSQLRSCTEKLNRRWALF